MLTIDVDVSEIVDMCERGELVFSRMKRNTLSLAKKGAARLRQIDPYTDRTGDLRKSTQAVDDGNAVVMEMGMHYASYVHNLGYSHFDDIAEQIEEQWYTGIDQAIEDI